MDVRNIRLAATTVYVVAILITVFFGQHWAATGAVAAIGGVLLGAIYVATGRMIADQAGRERPERSARREARRERRGE